MSWEIQSESVDLAEGTHRFLLINRSVIDRSGNAATHEFTIILGSGADGSSCPHCQQPVSRGLSLGEDGSLAHPELGELKPFDMVKAHLAKLDAFHARMAAYAKRHGATVYKGPK
jgi:hypothetical protein